VRPGLRAILPVIRAALFAAEASRLAVLAGPSRPSVVAILPVAPVLRLVGIGGLGLARVEQLLLAFLFVQLVFTVPAVLLVLILEPRPTLAQHSEIMVRELEIIFGLDPVARELSVARHALIFLEQLSGIAALPIVLPISGLSAEVLAPLSPAAASAAALTIVDQMPTSLRSSS